VGEGFGPALLEGRGDPADGPAKLDRYELTRTIDPTHLADSAIAPLFFPTITAADHASQQHSPGPADTRMPG